MQKPNWLDMSRMTSSFGVPPKRLARIILPYTHSRMTDLSHALFEVRITLGLKSRFSHLFLISEILE